MLIVGNQTVSYKFGLILEISLEAKVINLLLLQLTVKEVALRHWSHFSNPKWLKMTKTYPISAKLFFYSYSLKIQKCQDVMWVVVSTHTWSLAFISAGLKTRDNFLKTFVIQRPGQYFNGKTKKQKRKKTYQKSITYLYPE